MIDDVYHRQLRHAKRQFGEARFEIGRLLHHIRERNLWRGKARSFAEYLEAERLNPNAARQYMRVAKKLVIELQLDDTTLAELADVNMSTLDQAARVINPLNADAVLAKLTSLSERDAKYELSQMEPAPFQADRPAPEVAKLMAQFQLLPHELRIEALTRLGVTFSHASGTPGVTTR